MKKVRKRYNPDKYTLEEELKNLQKIKSKLASAHDLAYDVIEDAEFHIHPILSWDDWQSLMVPELDDIIDAYEKAIEKYKEKIKTYKK